MRILIVLDNHSETTDPQETLDRFRESLRPELEHGITLTRATVGDLACDFCDALAQGLQSLEPHEPIAAIPSEDHTDPKGLIGRVQVEVCDSCGEFLTDLEHGPTCVLCRTLHRFRTITQPNAN